MPAWRTVRVFVSSTFRDMHAERNHLVRVVFPALRERLQRHRVHLIDVDLRWGVTQEQVENNQVLDLCLGFVDECRPFSIGILGERYGWVPEHLSADTLARFEWLRDHQHRSLTELEILHAAFHAPQRTGQVFFFLRDPAAVASIPPEARDDYVEPDPAAAERLRHLKDRIRGSGFLVTEYPARWDADALNRVTRTRGELTGLALFGDRIFEQLWNGMRAELQLSDDGIDAPPDPLAEEAEYHERFMESRLRVYVGRRDLEAQLRHYAAGGSDSICAVTGPSGSGKSAALANLVAVVRRQHPDWLVIPHFVGAGPQSTDLRQMLRRFCLVLADAAPDETPDDHAQLVTRFAELIARVPAGRRVVFVIDALNQLDAAAGAHELEWLPATLPAHVKVVVSCIEDPARHEIALDALNARPHTLLRVETLTDVERFQIVHDVPMLSAKALDHTQVARLLDNPATANPLFLLVALEELRGFGSYERLRDRIEALPRGFDALDALFAQVIERLEGEFGEPLVRLVLASLASARRGLSEGELRELAGSADVYPVLRQLRPYLQHRGSLLDFYHRNLFKAVRSRYLAGAEPQRAGHAALAAFFERQPFVDERGINTRKVDELPWQRLHAEQWDELAGLLTAPALLESKAEAGLAFDLAADYYAALERLPEGHPEAHHLRLYNEALRRDLSFIARHPSTLFQSFWNLGWWYDSPQAAAFYEIPEGGWIDPPPWAQPGAKLFERLEAWRRGRESRGTMRPWVRALRPPPRPLGTGQRARLDSHETGGYVCGLAFLPNSNRLVAGHVSHDESFKYTAHIRVWDAESGALLRLSPEIEGDVEWLKLVDDGAAVVFGRYGHNAQAWDIGARQIIDVPDVDLATFAAAPSPDGSRRATASDGAVSVLNVADGERHDAFAGETHRALTTPAWFPDGRRLAFGSADRHLRIVDAVTAVLLHEIEAHSKPITFVAVSNDGRRVLSASEDRTLALWDAGTGALIRRIEGVDTHQVAWSPDGRLVATIRQGSSQIWLWDVDHAQPLRLVAVAIGGIAMSHDGALLADGWGRSVVVNDFESGAERMMLKARRIKRMPGVNYIAFAPDGRRLAAAMSDRTMRVWDLQRREETVLVPPPLSNLKCLDFSPDGQCLAAGTWMNDAPDYCKVLVWRLDTGDLQVLSGHRNGINDVRYAADGSTIASASTDGTVRLWSSATGDSLAVIQVADGRMHGVNRVRFTADDAALILVLSGPNSDSDGAVWIHDLASGVRTRMPDDDDPQALARRLPPRYRGLVRSFQDLTEFVVKDADTGDAIAWSSLSLGDFLTHPSGRMWAGASGVLTLEDPPDRG